MTISLERLFSGETNEILLNETYDFSAEPVQDAFPFAAPVKLTGKIEAKAQVVSLHAEAEVRYHAFCDRCAREAERVWHVPVRHILVEALQNEDDEGEYILVPERQLDLERLTLEDIYLFLPVLGTLCWWWHKPGTVPWNHDPLSILACSPTPAPSVPGTAPPPDWGYRRP